MASTATRPNTLLDNNILASFIPTPREREYLFQGRNRDALCYITRLRAALLICNTFTVTTVYVRLYFTIYKSSLLYEAYWLKRSLLLTFRETRDLVMSRASSIDLL